MKAAQNFEVIVDAKGNRVYQAYMDYETIPKGHKRLEFKVGDTIPKNLLVDLLMFNKEYLDVEIKNGKMVLPSDIKIDIEGVLKEENKAARLPPKYSRENLTQKCNKMGFNKFRDWTKKKFDLTDRSEAKLITEILKMQDTMRNKGEYLE